MFKKYQNLIQKSFLKALILGALIWVSYHLLFTRNGFIAQHQLEKENQQLRLQLDSIKTEMERTLLEIDRLQHDTFYIESIARTHFGYTKPGEKVYIIKEKQ